MEEGFLQLGNDTEKQWYAIRDLLVTDLHTIGNEERQNVGKAIELASTCSHPEAVWLSSIFANRKVTTVTEAKSVFLENKTDFRCRCFASALQTRFADAAIFEAANEGLAFAQARVAGHFRTETSFLWAKRAADQGERDGFRWLGWAYMHGLGCAKDLSESKVHFEKAANLGDDFSLLNLALLFPESDPERFRILGEGAARHYKGTRNVFLDGAIKNSNEFICGFGNFPVIYEIGRHLVGQINEEAHQVFQMFASYPRIQGAKECLEIYQRQVSGCKQAIHCFTLIGKRFGLIKDMRRMIGEYIWATRNTIEYKSL